MDLSDLTQKRLEHIESCRANGDKSHEIIAGLYSDPSHFIYEILQNADDAQASEVEFELTPSELSITHNGRKLFDFEDVDSITTVGSSTKADDVNAIGKFGAGFKSVFAITKTPTIHSRDFHFKITDFIVPEEIVPVNIEQEMTKIILPFDHLKNTDPYEQISERLQKLESESLLFLRNIKEIQWRTKTDSGHYLSEIGDNKASLISQINEEYSLIEYFLFTKNIQVDDTELNIVVAYQLKDKIIVPVTDSKLFVFFPTKEETGFKFLVHAPYKTTPSRESIPFDDTQNHRITEELAPLVAESIIGLKNSGLLNVNVLSMLPIDSENTHPIYSIAFEQVKSIFAKQALLPTITKKYEKADNVVLAREKALTNLEDSFNKNTWLSTEITHDKTPELRSYLINELDIKEITMQNFCKEISEEFIESKTDSWLVKFYASIVNNESLYRDGYQKGILRERPIIRLENDSHINPENDSGDIQVYLPTASQSKFKTVKRTLLEKPEAKQFLEKLGLKQPDSVTEIKQFIVPKYQGDVIEEQAYLEDVSFVMETWTNAIDHQKGEICDLLNSCWFVRCKNQVGDVSFQKRKETDVYFNSKVLLDWFSGGKDEAIYFIDIGSKITDEMKTFFECLDVDEHLKISKHDDPIPYGYDNDPRKFQRINGFNPNIDISGLEYALENINKFRSTFLWQILLTNNPSRLSGQTKTRLFLKEDFKKSEIENSKILDLLQKNHWLYNKEENLIEKPLSKILLNDLNDDYKKENGNIEELVKVLGLKLDKVAEFEKETGMKAVDKEEYDKFEKWQEAQTADSDESTDESDWKPEVSPENATLNQDDADWIKLEPEDLSGQDITKSSTDSGQENNDDNKPATFKNSKAIGEWGEKVAKKYLKEKYPENEVVWLNKSGNVGKGYDFVIKNTDNGEDIAYYEVKSKTDESPKSFQVSGTQWNWAKQLHNSKKGDMYKILLVSNAGTRQPKIRGINNPVELWKSGKLYADPVSIEL